MKRSQNDIHSVSVAEFKILNIIKIGNNFRSFQNRVSVTDDCFVGGVFVVT